MKTIDEIKEMLLEPQDYQIGEWKRACEDLVSLYEKLESEFDRAEAHHASGRDSVDDIFGW